MAFDPTKYVDEGISETFDQIGAPRILTLRKDGSAVYLERGEDGELAEVTLADDEPDPAAAPE